MNRNLTAEVLAPAGNYETFKAVINAGADAVYLGGGLYGARAYAGNLNTEELLKAIDYAHIHNRKIYLTVNTLLKNKEICGLYDYIRPFYEAGLDAVIVQDFGVMKFVNDNFPGLDIHASTQMTITEPEYIDFLEKYNVTRIVPARELGLSDIQRLYEYANKPERIRPMEIECFVHGALCYAYSGQCFMSSFFGGRSGNRGKCAGTCRLEYEKNRRRYPFLSLKDLCTLKLLPDILAAGVYSLKIEGRMKSAQYAAGVTSIYRHYVDLLCSDWKNYRVDRSHTDKLLMFFDRGGMTDGYYNRHNGAGMIADISKSDKSQTERTKLESVIKSQYIDNDIKENINIFVKLLKNNSAILTIESKGMSVTVTGDMVTEAQNRPMNREDIVKQLTKLGTTPFKAGNVVVDMDEGIFIPNRSLNELRRKAVEQLLDRIFLPYRRNAFVPEDLDKKNVKTAEGSHAPLVTVRAMTYEQAAAATEENIHRIYLESEIMTLDEMREVRKKCIDRHIQCYFAMPRVFRRGYNGLTEDNLLDSLLELDFDGVLIRNMAEYEYIRHRGFQGKYVADYTVYAYNNQAVDVLYSEGFDDIAYPVELNMGELRHLDIKSGELLVYGKIPLMVTANCIDRTCAKCHKPDSSFGTFKDRKNTNMTYLACCRHCYNVIYNSVPLYLIDRENDINGISPEYISFAFCDESSSIVREIISSGNTAVSAEFTRGHFTRGVE